MDRVAVDAFVRRTTLRQVEVIVALQEHRSMTKVAVALGMTVANVSRVTKRFELNLGARVFQDKTRSSDFTVPFNAIFPCVKAIGESTAHLRSNLITADPCD